MKERANAEKEYQKAVEAAETLSKRLNQEIQGLRSKQAEYDGYYKAEPIARSHYKRTTSIFKVDADAKVAEKVILDDARKIARKEIGSNVNISTETLLAATDHLNKMIDLIDPPFNPKKLPGIIFTILGSLGTLSGFVLLIAGGTVAAGIFLLPMITIPALIFGGAIVAGIGAAWWHSVTQNDSEALQGCKQFKQITGNQTFPSDDELDKFTVYYKVKNNEITQACWHENNGTENGKATTVDIPPEKSQKIMTLMKDTTVNYFDEIVTLLGYPSLTVQALNVEKAALTKEFPTQLANPVETPSSKNLPNIGTGVGLNSTQSARPFAQPPKTEGGEQPKPTVTPQQPLK